MIDLVLKIINALRVISDIYIELLLKIINAFRVISDIYDRACF